MATAKSTEDLQREVLETQLETAKIALEKTKDENADYRRKKEVAAKTNANRQRQFTADQRNIRSIQKRCQHMAGGDAEGDPLEGGGKFAFSILHITLMPDGVTEFLQCPRCRLQMYGRKLTVKEEAALKAKADAAKNENDPAFRKYDDYLWYKELRDLYRREGLGKKAISRGPTFSFTNGQGVPIIPDISGAATSGAGGR